MFRYIIINENGREIDAWGTRAVAIESLADYEDGWAVIDTKTGETLARTN